MEFRLYKGKGYNKEELVCSKEFGIDILDFELSKDDDSFILTFGFNPVLLPEPMVCPITATNILDLIEKYLKAMSDLGQDVIDLIVLRFPFGRDSMF